METELRSKDGVCWGGGEEEAGLMDHFLFGSLWKEEEIQNDQRSELPIIENFNSWDEP